MQAHTVLCKHIHTVCMHDKHLGRLLLSADKD